MASHKDDLCRGPFYPPNSGSMASHHSEPPFTAALSGFAVLFPGQFRIHKGRQDLRRWEWDLQNTCSWYYARFYAFVMIGKLLRTQFLVLRTYFWSRQSCLPFSVMGRSRNPTMGQPKLGVGCAHFTISVG